MTMTTYLLNSLILKMVYSSNLLDISTCYVQEQQELLQITPLQKNIVLGFSQRNFLLVHVENIQLNLETIFFIIVEGLTNIRILTGSCYRTSSLFSSLTQKHSPSIKGLLNGVFTVTFYLVQYSIAQYILFFFLFFYFAI